MEATSKLRARRIFRCAGLVAFCALASTLSCTSHESRTKPEPESRYSLWVLGCAQDGGVPHVGCRRRCCHEARKAGLRHYPASLGLVDRREKRLALVEATPEIDAQIALLQDRSGLTGRGRNPVDAVLLTHAHIGHYTGLIHFGREVASTKRLPVFASRRMARYLTEHGPWSQLVALEQIELRSFSPTPDRGATFELLPELVVEAIPVPHRDEFSDTMAYRIRGPNRTVLFVPDVDAWDKHDGLLERLMQGVDVAYLDGTFWDGSELPGRNLFEIPHPLITDTMDRLAEHARKKPGSIRFIHLNHTNPLWLRADLRAEVTRRGFALAQRGERVDL